MANVDVAQFEFVCNTGTGTQTIASGLGFTPKGYILWSTMNTADATYDEDYTVFCGFSDGTNTYSISSCSQDNQGSSYTGRVQAASFSWSLRGLTNADAVANHSSFGSGTIVINWTNAPSAAFKIYGIAFGGTNVSCEAKKFTAGRATAGQQSYTTTMSTPQCGIFLPTFGTVEEVSFPASFGLGIALSSTKRATMAIVSEEARNTMDTWRILDDTKVLQQLIPTTGAIEYTADFVSWDANGFTLNWTNPATDTGQIFYGFFLKGANFDMGVVAKRTSTGTTVVTPSSVGTIKGILLFSDNTTKTTASTTVQTDNKVSIGGASSTSLQGGCWAGDIDAIADSICVVRSEDSNILVMATGAATATSSTTNAIAAISAMGTDTFTLNYTTCDATTADLVWWAIGETAAGGELKYGTINESPSVSVSESLARVQTINKSISDTPTVGVSESLARLQTIIKSISDTPTISVSENLARGLVYPRPITNEPEVSVSAGILERIQYLIKLITNEPQVTIPTETIAKVAAYPRPISDTPAITISEALEKILTDIRSITNEQEVSIPVETLAKSAIYPRPISDTPSITVSESLARIQYLIKLITNEPEVSISVLLTGNFLISRLISESPSVSVSETLERLQQILRSISDTPEVTISELLSGSVPVILRPITEPSVGTTPTTVERIATFPRSITLADEPLISVNETLARLLLCLRNITNEPEITTSDTASILALITRTLTEPSQSISEEITRIQSLIKLISETPPISVSDSVTGLKGLLVSILESRIKWYYSLLTRKIPEGET